MNRLWVPHSFSWSVTPWVFSCVPLCFRYVPPCAPPCVPLYVLLLAANQYFRQCVPGCFVPSCVPCAPSVGLPLRFLVNCSAHSQCFPSARAFHASFQRFSLCFSVGVPRALWHGSLLCSSCIPCVFSCLFSSVMSCFLSVFAPIFFVFSRAFSEPQKSTI